MSKKLVPSISITGLELSGWKQTGDPVTPMEKKLVNKNPLNASEDSDIKLVIHKLYNTETFAVILPDGGMLNFQVKDMVELQAFEKAIAFYDPPF